ncbi:hypothetical protein VdG1_00028 [Verticillium dahliae VDG1]|nr:hypothetical protein VdG1_00028 [Verticillium dahliae VDG1]
MSDPSRQQLLQIFKAQLTAFQQSRDAFTVFSEITPPSSPSTPPKTLIVLDSSFNPPTVAHLRMAASAIRAASHAIADTRVLLLLAVNNADKAPQPVAFPTRMALMQHFALDLTDAIEGDGVAVDLGLTTLPYFPDKSAAIADEGRYGDAEQVFLAGYDTLVRIFDPKYYPGGMAQALGPDGGFEQAGGRREWAERVELVDGDEEVVSSTRVRQALKGREAADEKVVDKFITPAVREWVLEEKLYQDE